MADFTFVDGNAPSASTWNSNVRDQLCVICTSSTRPSSPVTGRVIFETDTNREMRYDGSAWQQVGQLGAWTTYTPTWTTSGVAPAIGNGTIPSRYVRISQRLAVVNINLQAGSTTTFGTGAWSFTLPASLTAQLGWGAAGGLVSDSSTSDWFPIQANFSGGTVLPVVAKASGDCRLGAVTATVPMTWATNDQINMTFVAELY